MNNYILTLDFIKKHCEGITGHWNGSDEKFIDADGEARTEDDVQAAQEILTKVAELEELLKEIL